MRLQLMAGHGHPKSRLSAERSLEAIIADLDQLEKTRGRSFQPRGRTDTAGPYLPIDLPVYLRRPPTPKTPAEQLAERGPAPAAVFSDPGNFS
jgi:hypothetical protein